MSVQCSLTLFTDIYYLQKKRATSCTIGVKKYGLPGTTPALPPNVLACGSEDRLEQGCAEGSGGQAKRARQTQCEVSLHGEGKEV